MSWTKVFKINKNMKRSLDEQMRDLKFQPIRIITQSTTYTPEKTGLYKVICIGAGGNGSYNDSFNNYSASGGSSGSVAIKTLKLTKSTSYNVTVSTTSSFSTELTATSSGGTATGGDYNFNGVAGGYTTSDGNPVKGGSVGVAISDLFTIGTSSIVIDFTSDSDYTDRKMLQYELFYGDSLLGYGGGGGAVVYDSGPSTTRVMDGRKLNGLPAAVLIIPLEMEE